MSQNPTVESPSSDHTRFTLIERVKRQYDEAAWKEFADIYKGYIYAVIRNLAMSEHDAEEVHQKVMVKLWEKLPTLDTSQIRRFRSYLAMVAKNEVKQFIRARERRMEREMKSLEAGESDYLNSIRLPEIEKIAEEEWKVHLTNLAFKKIEGSFSKKAMEVFRLSVEGVSPDEIAEQTGIARGSIATLKARVKTRFFKEIEILREDLE
jgi:RNA polymerase sigma factor (sigma-70 family)